MHIVNCAEARELIGPILDSQLAVDIKSAFHDHIANCYSCKREYELERLAKALVQSNLKRAALPDNMRRTILSNVYGEPAVGNLLERVRSTIIQIPGTAYAATLAAIILVIILFPNTPAEDPLRHVGERDVMVQASANLVSFRNGTLQPSLTACSPESIYKYLMSQKVPFKVNVRPIEQCDAYSAIVNEYEGVRLAHVVYKLDKDLLYVYQVKKEETIGGGAHLAMPEAAMTSLQNTGWYTDSMHAGCNVVLWEENGTLCAAASTMTKKRMLEVLAER